HHTLCLSHRYLSTATPTPQLYTLSLHDALPISTGTKATIQVLRSLLAENHVQVLTAAATGDPSGTAWAEAGELDHQGHDLVVQLDRKSTRLNSSHVKISYAVFCLKKKKKKTKYR